MSKSLQQLKKYRNEIQFHKGMIKQHSNEIAKRKRNIRKINDWRRKEGLKEGTVIHGKGYFIVNK